MPGDTRDKVRTRRLETIAAACILAVGDVEKDLDAIAVEAVVGNVPFLVVDDGRVGCAAEDKGRRQGVEKLHCNRDAGMEMRGMKCLRPSGARVRHLSRKGRLGRHETMPYFGAMNNYRNAPIKLLQQSTFFYLSISKTPCSNQVSRNALVYSTLVRLLSASSPLTPSASSSSRGLVLPAPSPSSST